MGTLLDKLYEYHQLTLKLYHVNQQIESQQRRARVQALKLEEHARRIDELHTQIRMAQVAANEADVDLKGRDSSLERLRTQLNTTKTNKEYSALLREINSFKADSNRIEERALKKLAEVDELKAQMAQVQQQVEQEKRRLEELRKQGEGREQELSEQVRDVSKQREQAAGELPSEVLTHFNRVAEAHEGEAMAPIIKSNPKREEYACGGCNLSVTLEQVNSLQSRDDIQVCNCCGRLLYLGESALPSRS